MGANAKQVGCIGSDFRLEAVDGSAFTYQWSGPNGFVSKVRNPFIYQVTEKDSGWYTVLVSTEPGCTRVDSFHIAVFPGVKASVSAGVDICEGASTLLSASGGTSYRWWPVNGLSDSTSASPLASPIDTTVYKVVVSNQYGCRDSGYIRVGVFKRLIVNAGPDKAIFEGDTVTLNGMIQGTPSDIYWTPSVNIRNGNTATPVVDPVDNTTYTLSAVSGSGCPVETDEAFVRVYKKLQIPNVFSPNGDGINDTWVIRNMDTYPLATLRVFSRSGQVVFETKTGGREWDGTHHGHPLPLATYYYVIDMNIGQPPVSGWVMIVR